MDRVVGSDDTVALCISGRITKQELDALCGLIEEEATAVAIDLKNVVLVDREAVKFFAQREIDGTVLRNCPPYIRESVTRERAETTETMDTRMPDARNSSALQNRVRKSGS
jgi:hypothetical protein